MVFLTDLLFRYDQSYRRDEHCSSENDGRHLFRISIDRIIAFSAMRMVNDHSVALRKHVFASLLVRIYRKYCGTSDTRVGRACQTYPTSSL